MAEDLRNFWLRVAAEVADEQAMASRFPPEQTQLENQEAE